MKTWNKNFDINNFLIRLENYL